MPFKSYLPCLPEREFSPLLTTSLTQASAPEGLGALQENASALVSIALSLSLSSGNIHTFTGT